MNNMGNSRPFSPNDLFRVGPKLVRPSQPKQTSKLSSSFHPSGGDGLLLCSHRSPMKFKSTVSLFYPRKITLKSSLSPPKSLMATTITQTRTQTQSQTESQSLTLSSASTQEPDDSHCIQQGEEEHLSSYSSSSDSSLALLGSPRRCVSSESRIDRAWAHWKNLGQPKLIVAPMVDNSELPFRMLCRKYGAEAAYTPMLHSRIFTETEKYRSQEFTTCKEDRPLFVQFCANNSEILLEAARIVEPYCDYVDINLGCPQHIARRGNYGAFLMDNLPLIKSLVQKLALNLDVPVSCKIRIFPNLQDTINYAKMLEEAGCSLLAVHGRKRDEKDQKKLRADWDAIKAVKNAVKIPVLANGNIRHMDDVKSCLEATGADGVLSAESLLENPALFAGFMTAKWGEEGNNEDGKLDQADLLVEYLKLCEQYPVPWRIVRSHVHKLMGEWFRIHPEVREDLNAQHVLTFEFLYSMVDRLRGLGARIPLYVKSTNEGNGTS